MALPGSSGTVTFKYHPFGRRIYKSSPSGTSVFVCDGDNLIEETNSSGNVVARYTQTQYVDEPLAMLRSGATHYYNADGLGSITSLTNGSGAVAASYTYNTFGNLAASTGSLPNPFRYTAREWDAETALYYYRARFYDSGIGRFMSEDPIGFAGGINRFAYVKNQAVNLSDPLGLFEVLDRIDVRRVMDVRYVCPDTTSAACTYLQSVLLCTCEKDGCGDNAQ